MDEMLSFEDVMIQLRVTIDDLKRMIAEGELRAFRTAEGAMSFRKADVDALKAPRSPATDVLVIKPLDPIPPPPPEGGALVKPRPRAKAKKPAPAGKKPAGKKKGKRVQRKQAPARKKKR